MSDLGNKEIMAKNIKYYMQLNNVSRKEICNSLGFKYTTFSDWINAKKYPRIDKIEMIANYFNIEKSDLVEDRKSKVPDSSKNINSQLVDLINKYDDGLKVIGNLCQRTRIKKALTEKDVANQIFIDLNDYILLEQGQNIGINKIAKALSFLGINVHYLDGYLEASLNVNDNPMSDPKIKSIMNKVMLLNSEELTQLKTNLIKLLKK